jgi:enoyl-CoA hydratase
MSWETVTLEWDDSVATLTIDRPERRNAINVETLNAVSEALATAAEEGAQVLVLTGAGDDAFVAGADIEYMAELSVQEAHTYAERGHAVTTTIATFPAPVIAAINGYAFGGGCELALAADLRVASEQAVIGQPEIDLGIIPGWGGTQRLSRLVGDERARRLIFFGERIDAQTAHEYGLVGEVVAHDQLYARIADLTDALTEKPTFALHAAKEALNQVHQTDLSAGLDYERRLWSSLFGTDDQREGMRAFSEDRDPDFA